MNKMKKKKYPVRCYDVGIVILYVWQFPAIRFATSMLKKIVRLNYGRYIDENKIINIAVHISEEK